MAPRAPARIGCARGRRLEAAWGPIENDFRARGVNMATPRTHELPISLTEGIRERQSIRRISGLFGHELRTPVAAALMQMAIARRRAEAGAAGDLVSSALDTAAAELRRLDDLIARLVELLREGRPAILTRLVDLGRVVRGAVERTLAAEPDLRALVRLDVGGRLTGWWDPTAVEQITQNLLVNAGKFGEGRPIRVSASRTHGGARIVIQDRGCGIPLADQGRVFERGFCALPSQNGGLGLGLWLVRELAEAHRGGVAVRSAPGLGATFSVVLREGEPLGVMDLLPRQPPQAGAPTRSRTASTMAAAGARPSTGRSSVGSSSTGGS